MSWLPRGNAFLISINVSVQLLIPNQPHQLLDLAFRRRGGEWEGGAGEPVAEGWRRSPHCLWERPFQASQAVPSPFSRQTPSACSLGSGKVRNSCMNSSSRQSNSQSPKDTALSFQGSNAQMSKAPQWCLQKRQINSWNGGMLKVEGGLREPPTRPSGLELSLRTQTDHGD